MLVEQIEGGFDGDVCDQLYSVMMTCNIIWRFENVYNDCLIAVSRPWLRYIVLGSRT